MSCLRGGLVVLVGLALLPQLPVQGQQPEKARPMAVTPPPGGPPRGPLPKPPPPEPPDTTLPSGSYGRLGTPQPGRSWIPIYSLAFAPDGKTLAAGTTDKTVRLWEVATGKQVRQFGEPRQVGVHAVAFAPDGKTLAAGNYDDHLTLWETDTGKPLHQLDGVLGEGCALKSVAFSPDGQLVAAAGGPRIRLRESATGKEVRAFVGHMGMVNTIAFSPDGKSLASGSADRTLRLWNVADGQLLHNIVEAANIVYSLAFSPDGKTLAAAGEDGMIYLWDLANRDQVRQIAGKAGPFRAVAFSPDGKTIVAAGLDQTIRLWEVASCQERRQFKAKGVVYTVAFAPDGQTAASGGMGDATVLLWDVTGLRKDGRIVARPLPAGEAETLWADLTGADAAKAYQAMWILAEAPQQAVPLIQTHLRPPPADAVLRVDRLVADLDSERFATREKATQELEQIGEAAEPALRKALAAGRSIEVRRRIEQLLGKLVGGGTATEQFRGPRAVETLEHMNTPEARQLLERLAAGPPTSVLTRDAQLAVKRLEKQGARR